VASSKRGRKIFETKYFGLIIGLIIFLVMFLLNHYTVLFSNLELKVLDYNFRLKNMVRESRVQEGVTLERKNPNVSDDIIIVGIDDRTLSKYGRWPFPRYMEANLVNAFSRIRNQNNRERALLLDIFFIEPERQAENDALLVESIKHNKRVFLETVLTYAHNYDKEFLKRQEILFKNCGEITNVKGDWTKIDTFNGTLPPLQPYARVTYGYGHANFIEDSDTVYRRVPLITKLAVLEKEIPLDKLTVNEPVDRSKFERLAWIDKNNIVHNIPYPLTKEVLANLKIQMEKYAPLKAEDTNNDRQPDKYYYVIRKYRDYFIPAITLSLALDYFNKKLSDVEVVVGKYVKIENPEHYNVKKGKWEPYYVTVRKPVIDRKTGKVIKEGVYKRVNEIKIPINERGEMLVNFMGNPSSASPQGYQTFPVRPFYGYAQSDPGSNPKRWPRTKGVANKIILVGPFSKGIAEDQKPTPFGLMYGVEIHANALNTIIMNKFLYTVPAWIDNLILLGLILFTAFLVSRISTIWSLVVTFLTLIVYFFVMTFAFEMSDYILHLIAPSVGVLVTLLSVEAYRIMTEERDKRRIKNMFGKYVSPKVVEQILENPPELGGVDKNLTVFFSDIRGFTTLSESMTPQELVNHLNTYLTAMTDIILEYNGTLDKYVGDEIMCFWGAPVPQEDHALLACKCALKQMEKLRELNENWPEERRINIGIGINSGIMTVGNMGSLGRMNYTLMGDNVNLGARLEGTNKQYLTNIIISEYTYGLVKDKVIARELDNIRVKGKNKPVLIYELVDVIDEDEDSASG